MRTYQDVFGEEDPQELLARCHPVNGVDGFRLWCDRVMGLPLKDFHLSWVGPLITKSFDRVAISAPATFGKSQLFGICYPLWCCWFNESDPSWEGLIVSTSLPQAAKILARIKEAVNDNELLMNLKSSNNEAVWSASEIKFRNNCGIAVKPLNENVKSYHVNYVFCDEVASYSDWDCFFKYVSTRISAKKGELAAVSTPEGDGDLLTNLQSKDNYHSIVTAALVDPLTGEPDVNGESIWPERYPTSYLRERRREIGDRAFMLQYMCDTKIPLDDEGIPFPLSLLARNSDRSLSFEYSRDEGAEYYAAYDPAFSMEGDFNAVWMAKVLDGKIYISKGFRQKGDPDDVIEVIKGWANIFKPVMITVDANAGGSKIMRDMTKHNLPVTPFSFASQVRLDAIRETISRLHSGIIVLPMSDDDSETKRMMEHLFNELTHIVRDQTPTGLFTYKSKSSHDDCAMAFIMLINSIPEISEAVSFRRRSDCPQRVARSSRNRDVFGFH